MGQRRPFVEASGSPPETEAWLHRGLGGPHDCGHYNAAAWETGFFVSQGGSWDSEYGCFFLGWYSGALLAHGDRVLAAAAQALGRRGRPRRARSVTEVCAMGECPFAGLEGGQVETWMGYCGRCLFCIPLGRAQVNTCCAASSDSLIRGKLKIQRVSADTACAAAQQADGHLVYEFEAACHLGAKLAGVHWWFKSRAHAAELTAGYYNTRERDGYADVMAMLRRHRARLSFTCVEMRDCEHPPEGRCSPQGAPNPNPMVVGCVCQSTSSAVPWATVEQQGNVPCAQRC